jgi:hypothetical protein
MLELAVSGHPAGPAVPALIAAAGDRAAWRFIEFFTVNIRNANTRAAYRLKMPNAPKRSKFRARLPLVNVKHEHDHACCKLEPWPATSARMLAKVAALMETESPTEAANIEAKAAELDDHWGPIT